MKTKTFLTAFAAALLLSASGAFAQADCERGTLVDPDTLIFAYTPVEDPAVYKEAWSDFLDIWKKLQVKTWCFSPCNQMLLRLKLCAQVVCTLPDLTLVQIRWQ